MIPIGFLSRPGALTNSARFLVPAVLGVLFLSSCAPGIMGTAGPTPEAPAKPALTLVKTSFDQVPGWADGRQDKALPAFLQSCSKWTALPTGRSLGPVGGTVADWRAPCEEAKRLKGRDAATARNFFEIRFTPYLAVDNGEARGLFTGYYEAELRGSKRRGGPFQTPIYARPADLVTADLGAFRDEWKGDRISGRIEGGRLRPYPDRNRIEAGALRGRGLELLWVDDPIDAFFLHIQGSGRVRMTDGSVLRLGFAGKNGRPYHAIGRDLTASGAIPKEAISMGSIRAWLKDNPAQGRALMARNKSFIFFRKVAGGGPIGAAGVALTPGRSLAVDPKYVSYGVPVWLDTQKPLERGPLRRLVVAQDTGGAIKGPVRGDLFWGFGREAAALAGAMKSTGRAYFLLPKAVLPKP